LVGLPPRHVLVYPDTARRYIPIFRREKIALTTHEVVYEMEINGYSRTEATKRVAQNRGTSPQTITDKYCRQIGKKAQEIDGLLSEPGYEGFKEILKGKYDAHQQVIDSYFETLMLAAD
jgi:hypothetical protein